MNNLLSKSKNLLHKLKNIINTNNNNNIMLGRWETSRKFIDIKSTQANFDSCGDKLCGTPHELIKFTKIVK
jgi:hypothetical protein